MKSYSIVVWGDHKKKKKRLYSMFTIVQSNIEGCL